MTPEQILQSIYDKAVASLKIPIVNDKGIKERIDYVCLCMRNRSGVRLLMACLLGKLHNPKVDPRKPYTEIGTTDSFSGRKYDEQYLTHFINLHRLPCNPTTAFLTPTLRNMDKPLTKRTELVGRPRELYVKTLQLLDDVAQKRVTPDVLLAEVVRVLLLFRDEKLGRMKSLFETLKHGEEGALPLCSEAIVGLIKQHLDCKNSSRLPVLIVAAAYKVAGERLGEHILPLKSHNAADLQTGCFGDIEICLEDDDKVVTVYEMKMKRVTIDDIDVAVAKIAKVPKQINNYIFVTTDTIELAVVEYANKLYDETGGTEIAILDCIGFLRHFLHFFHRLRTAYLNVYQTLVLGEPDSSINQTLKETFLTLRVAAETGE
jgi:hypothetical protein